MGHSTMSLSAVTLEDANIATVAPDAPCHSVAFGQTNWKVLMTPILLAQGREHAVSFRSALGDPANLRSGKLLTRQVPQLVEASRPAQSVEFFGRS